MHILVYADPDLASVVKLVPAPVAATLGRENNVTPAPLEHVARNRLALHVDQTRCLQWTRRHHQIPGVGGTADAVFTDVFPRYPSRNNGRHEE